MNQPTQAILQKYGISPTPNPPQAVSGNAQVKNVNSSTVNNQVNNKIIIIQPQIPIAQPNIQLRDSQGENLRNWISNQFKAQQQKYQEETNFYRKYGERITEGIQKITKSVTSATERFAENMNPQRLSQTMTDSKKVIMLMALAILATKFIGPLSRRLDKLYTWFVGDKEKKGFVEKFKDIFFQDNQNEGLLSTLKKGISYGLQLLKGYVKLAFDDRVRALTELRTKDLDDLSLFDYEDIPILIMKVFAAMIGGSKGLGYIKTTTAAHKVKKKVIERFQKRNSDIKDDFDALGNVKNKQDSALRVQKKIEGFIQDTFNTYQVFSISIPYVLTLLEALKNAVFTCYQSDDKLVRGTIISDAKHFLSLLGYKDDEIEGLYKNNFVVTVKSLVIDKNKSQNLSNYSVITKEGWKVMARLYGGEDVSVSDKNYWTTLEQRLLENWKAYWREKLKDNKWALNQVESVSQTTDWQAKFYKDEVAQLQRAWDFTEELQAARVADEEMFEYENKDALDFFRNLKNSITGNVDDLEEIDSFNENNYVAADGEFNTEGASKRIHQLSYEKYDDDLKQWTKDGKSPNTSSRHCAKHVRMAIEEGGGISLAGNPEHAYQYLAFLPKKGFKLIHSGRKRDLQHPDVYPWPDDLKQGDVVVFNKTDDHKSGHIAMYDGQQWYSDFAQGTWHGMIDRGFNEFGVFRYGKFVKEPENAEVTDQESRESPEESSPTEVSPEVTAKMEEKSSLFKEPKPKVTPTSVTPEKTEKEKNLGTRAETPKQTPSPTNQQPSQPSTTSTNNTTNDNQSEEQQTITEEERKVAVSTYAMKGSVRQVVLNHVANASYVNGIKK